MHNSLIILYIKKFVINAFAFDTNMYYRVSAFVGPLFYCTRTSGFFRGAQTYFTFRCFFSRQLLTSDTEDVN